MFVLVRMQLRNQVNSQSVKSFKRYKRYAIFIQYQIWNVSSARGQDFTAEMV